MSIIGYRQGEGLVEHADRVAAPQNMLGTEMFIRKPYVPDFLGGVCPEDLRRDTVSLLRLRPSSGMRSLPLRPKGRIETHVVGRLQANALLWRCFPVVCRHLLHPPLALIRPYPPRRLELIKCKSRPWTREYSRNI
jgi:hypothetical protein